MAKVPLGPQPSWGTALGAAGAVAPALVALIPGAHDFGQRELALLSLGGTFGGLTLGMAWDVIRYTMPASKLDEWALSVRSIFEKAKEDFDGTIFNSWNGIDSATKTIKDRIEKTQSEGFCSYQVCTFAKPKSLHAYLRLSECHRGVPRSESLRCLDMLDEIKILSSTLHTGAALAFMIMIEDFGLRLNVVDHLPHGIAQMRYLEHNHDFDFAVIADANVNLYRNPSFATTFVHILPCFWNIQYLIERGTKKSYTDPQLFVAEHSSAHEQTIVGSNVLSSYGSSRSRPFDINDLASRIRTLDDGQGALAWTPLVQVNAAREDRLFVTPCNDYRLSTSLYWVFRESSGRFWGVIAAAACR